MSDVSSGGVACRKARGDIHEVRHQNVERGSKRAVMPEDIGRQYRVLLRSLLWHECVRPITFNLLMNKNLMSLQQNQLINKVKKYRAGHRSKMIWTKHAYIFFPGGGQVPP